MLRLLTLIFSTLLLALPLTGAVASAAPARTAVHAAQADDSAGDDAADDTADDPSDDPADDPVDLSDLCALAADDSSGDAGATDDSADAGDDSSDDPVTVDLGVLDSVDPGADDPEDVPDPADDPSDGIDCSDTGDDAGATLSGGGTDTVSVTDILKSGVVSTGTVKMSGPGVVTQELWLPAAAPAARHGLRAAGATKGKRSANAKGRKVAGRTLGGRVVKTVTRAGTVKLKVRLNGAARTLLRRTKKDVRITVKTTTRLRGGKAHTRNGTLVAHRKAAKK